MGGVTYDSGALVAAERNNRAMWALHAGFLAEEAVPIVPAPAPALAEAQSRAVGVLAGKSGHDDIVDVTVVEGAVRRGDAVVTSNEDHIRLVARATRARMRIHTI
jgi:hypothetical protein